ncbi:hypothetical protein H4S08_001053 [Coemansia sp. RSA 1365]|nr:hypothetical protein H4S08_001053 [Coemansia sp. RSA 1365]
MRCPKLIFEIILAKEVQCQAKEDYHGRAADLVGNDVAAINAFKANPALAFSQLSMGPRAGSTDGRDSGTSTPRGLDQIDGQLAGQLKRLSKHDSNTKLRALAELRLYVEEHSWDTGLEGMLLVWPQQFQRLVFDPDRRVRAMVAQINAELIAKSGRRLASALKALIGAWVASFFDPHREVARASRQAFETAFSKTKRREVYGFCMGELLEYAADNIVEQTAESLSDSRFTSKEEMQSKYEHVVGASFGVLTAVVEEAEQAQVTERKSELDALLQNRRALGQLSSTSAYVRRSIYRLIRVVMMCSPELAYTWHMTMGQALLRHCFNDGDASAHGDMWDAVLLLTKNYPQIWEVGSGKSPIERVFAFLRSRSRLAPTISYPSVLALLAQLPPGMIDTASFRNSLHEALWQGAGDNGAESVALVTCVSECFAFLWTRAQRLGDMASMEKEAVREMDALWHWYVQHRETATELAGPVVRMYCKLERLSAKHDPQMLGRLWAQTSWFALQRATSQAAPAVVELVAQIAHLDKASYAELARSGHKLLDAFCRVAVESEDAETVHELISALVKHAPDEVFGGGYANALSQRLEDSGAAAQAAGLVLSQARYVATSGGGAEQAARGVDAYVAAQLVGGAERMETALQLLRQLPAGAEGGWDTERLTATEARLEELLPSASAAAEQLVDACGQALRLRLAGSGLIGAAMAEKLLAWTAQVVETACGARRSEKEWQQTAQAVLVTWAALASDAKAGAAFVLELVLQPQTALGLFALAEDPAHALHTAAQAAWAAVETQVATQCTGVEVARALGEAIGEAVDSIASTRSPQLLARLAAAVVTRVCPEDDTQTCRALVSAWLHDDRGPTDADANINGCWLNGAPWNGGELRLLQAVDSAYTHPFFTLTQWLAASEGLSATPAFDAGGRSRAARRAMFAAGLMQTLETAGFAGVSAAQAVVRMEHMVLAFVQLREAMARMGSGGPREQIAETAFAAEALQGAASDLLARASASADHGQWLVDVVESVVTGSTVQESAWVCVATRAASRADWAWSMALGHTIEWSAWAQPLASAVIEVAVAETLSRRLASGPLDAPTAAAMAVVARAVDLRRACARAPALRCALLEVAAHAWKHLVARAAVPFVATLELLAELLPAQDDALSDRASAPAVLRVLRAVSDFLPTQTSVVQLATTLAALAVLRRLARCTSLDDTTAAELVVLSRQWTELPTQSSEYKGALLAAATQALAALGHSAHALTGGALTAAIREVGPTLKDACMGGATPVATGVEAIVQLAELLLVRAPKPSRIYALLATAAPRLSVLVVRLARATPKVGAADELLRVLAATVSELQQVGAEPTELGDAAAEDARVCATAVRLVAGLALVAQQASILQEDGAALEQLAEQLAAAGALETALPWLCGLLGLPGRGFEAQRWEVRAGLAWNEWGAALERRPSAAGRLLALAALHVLFELARALPATLRAWWAGLPATQRALGQAVEQFFTRHVGAVVVASEMAHVQAQAGGNSDGPLAQALKEHDDAGVRVGATQATVKYTVDDATLELALRLPSTYPLAPAALDAVRRVAVSEKRWRAWAVATHALLARNADAGAACALLVRNIGAHFAGVEDCSICYSAVGALDNSLPTKKCRTCKNKFHRMCLFKWFSTSNQSTCPLCRNLF